VTNNYDSLLRRASVIVAGIVAALNSYPYDLASRLQTVVDGTSSAAYSYLANSPLINQITFNKRGLGRFNEAIRNAKVFSVRKIENIRISTAAGVAAAASGYSDTGDSHR
jgi:hypothetical protein